MTPTHADDLRRRGRWSRASARPRVAHLGTALGLPLAGALALLIVAIRFHRLDTLLVLGGLALLVVVVVTLTDFTLICSTLALPLTDGPVWLAARHPARMGEHTTGRLGQAIGGLGLLLTILVALVAIPVLVLG